MEIIIDGIYFNNHSISNHINEKIGYKCNLIKVEGKMLINKNKIDYKILIDNKIFPNKISKIKEFIKNKIKLNYVT